MEEACVLLLAISFFAACSALRVSTQGTSTVVTEHTEDLVLRCSAMFLNSEDELVRVTWYHIAPPTGSLQEIFTVDVTGEQPVFIFSYRWAGRGMAQPMREGATTVSVMLPARFVTRQDGGRYRCHMRTLLSAAFNEVIVTIHYGPGTSLVISPGGHVQTDEGVELILSCSAQCKPYCNYRWYRKGAMISNASVLRILSLSREDSGLYACQAGNMAGRSIKPVDVRVRVAASVTALSMTIVNDTKSNFPVPLQDEYPKSSGRTGSFGVGKFLTYATVALVCNVSGWPEPTIKWDRPRYVNAEFQRFGLNPLLFHSHVNRLSLTEKSSIAILNNVTCLDNGEYSCSVFNNYGLSSSTSMSGYKKSITLDLSCPPIRISGTTTTFTRNAMSNSQGERQGFVSYLSGTHESTLCQSDLERVETNADVETIVVKFNTTITITACFAGNPKPSLTFGRQNHSSAVHKFRSPFLAHYEHDLSQDQKRSVPDSTPPQISRTKHHQENNDEQFSNKNKSVSDNTISSEDQMTKTVLQESSINARDENNYNNDLNSDVKYLTIKCSTITNSNICVGNISITLSNPDQYGIYVLWATNSLGRSQRKYEVISKQAPLSPYTFQLVNVSSDYACFSWIPGFNGGARQSFHLECYEESEQKRKNVSVPGTGNQEPSRHACYHAIVLSGDRSKREKNSGSHTYEMYSHCLTPLSSLTRYRVILYSSNQYGNSTSPREIIFQTKSISVQSWKTLAPEISFISSTSNLTLESILPTSSPIPSIETEFELGPSGLPEYVSNVFLLHQRMSSENESVDEEIPPEDVGSVNHKRIGANLVRDSQVENDNADFENTEIDSQIQELEYENEDDYIQELIFDEDDLIYGEINDMPFFQFFDAQLPIRDDYLKEEPTGPSTNSNMNVKRKNIEPHNFHLNRRKTPPVHLQKLLLRYSRPHSKLDVTKHDIKSMSISIHNSFFSTTSSRLPISVQPTAPEDVDLINKDLTVSYNKSKFKFVVIFLVTGFTFCIILLIFIFVCMRMRRRQRRLQRLKLKYKQRSAEENSGRRRYSAVEVEDANLMVNRNSSIRGARMSDMHLHAPPIHLPHQAPVDPETLSAYLERMSIRCVANENAVYPTSSLSRPAAPEPLRQIVDLEDLAPQRKLRPTSSTPEGGNINGAFASLIGKKKDNLSFSNSSSPQCTTNFLRVPTITVGEDGDACKNNKRFSFPCPFETDSNNCLFMTSRDLRDVDRLRPPSHHSSYSSLRQGPVLLRMDSSSSGATANYFNLYEGLTFKSTRSRSPSNIYDPLTFEFSPRSNSPSRGGSPLELSVSINREDACETPSINKNMKEGVHKNTSFCGRVNPKQDEIDTYSVHSYTDCMSMPAQALLHKIPNTSAEEQSVCGNIQFNYGLHDNVICTKTRPLSPLLNHSADHSGYEQIVKHSTLFCNDKSIPMQRNDFSGRPKTIQRGFDLKSLWRWSLPKSSKEVPASLHSKNRPQSLRSKEEVNVSTMKPISLSSKKHACSESDKTAQGLNASLKNLKNNGGSEIAESMPMKDTHKNIPVPPALDHDSCLGMEEPIYTDIDEDTYIPMATKTTTTT
ncbi:hypothetical protein PoB_001943300 [Plakobranchus ocellatus]|uniref:Ig-like domain-containing protein n=1 Tax=Plakobranchus ocellatus TaxID=259542 RepID=A0AAV3ZDV7_9GAST|nr:hypothetical protein PoB_001943300 [Plakobranchus ocellatus]